MSPRLIQGLLLLIVLASGTNIANRFLTQHFDSLSQNFYRFAAGAVLLLCLSMFRIGTVRSLLSKPRDAARAVVCGTLIAGVMYLGIRGLAGISAATASMLAAASTPTTIALSMLLFADERCGRPVRFTLGVAMLVAATGAYSIAATGASGGGVDQWWGIGMFAGAMVGRSALSLLLKDVLRRQDSQAVASLNALMCTLVLAVWAAVRWGVQGNGVMPPQAAGWPIAALLIASGLVGIWTGVGLNNWLISGLGLVRVHLSICAVPPVVAVAGWLILGEAVGIGQLACGAILLACVAYLMRLKNAPAPAPEDATRPDVEGPAMDGPALPVPPVPEYVHDAYPTPPHDPSRR